MALGVAYQLVDQDPLVDANQCQLDAAIMKQLGANSIRVYHVDATADHKGCMDAFAAAGIYLWVDMDSFKTYITIVCVAKPIFRELSEKGLTWLQKGRTSWTTDKSDSFRAVMDNFQQYDNTAGFFAGNEVLNVRGYARFSIWCPMLTIQ